MAGQKGIKAGQTYVEAYMDDSRLIRGVKSMGKTVQGAATGLLAMGAAMSAMFLPAIAAAGKMSAVMASFQSMFGKSSKDIGKWADSLATGIGRAKTQVREFATSTKGRLAASGMDDATANSMTKKLTERAFDLAAFSDRSDEDATLALNSGMTGEMESLKGFGIVINQAMIDAELKKLGINKNTASETDKIMARFNLIMEKSTTFAGTAARESGEYGNQVKSVSAKFQELQETVGIALLPIVLDLFETIGPLVDSLAEWARTNPTLVKYIALLAGLFVGAGGIVMGVTALAAVLAGPAGLVIGIVAVTAVLAGLALSAGNVAEAMDRLAKMHQKQLDERQGILKTVNDEANNKAIQGGEDSINNRRKDLAKQKEVLKAEMLKQDFRIKMVETEKATAGAVERWTGDFDGRVKNEQDHLKKLEGDLQAVEAAEASLEAAVNKIQTDGLQSGSDVVWGPDEESGLQRLVNKFNEIENPNSGLKDWQRDEGRQEIEQEMDKLSPQEQGAFKTYREDFLAKREAEEKAKEDEAKLAEEKAKEDELAKSQAMRERAINSAAVLGTSGGDQAVNAFLAKRPDDSLKKLQEKSNTLLDRIEKNTKPSGDWVVISKGKVE